MKINELISLLKTHPNQEAEIVITANPSINGEDEDMEILLNEIAVYHFVDDFIQIFAYNKKFETWNEAPYGND